MSKPAPKRPNTMQEGSSCNLTFHPYRARGRGRNNRRNVENTRPYFSMQYPPVHRNDYNNIYYAARPTRFYRVDHRNRNVQNVKKKPRKLPEKKYSRPPSPSVGNKEEDKLRRIRETSDLIKELMMSPKLNMDKSSSESTSKGTSTEKEDTSDDNTTTCVKRIVESESNDKEKTENKRIAKNASNKKENNYTVEEIHNKIITHISNLSYNKKMKLISSASAGYNIVFDQIAKQKQLELSKALRDMCSEPSPENTEQINSMMPDFDIKIEELPMAVIEVLSNTLGCEFDKNCSLESPFSLVKAESLVNDEQVSNYSQGAEIDDSVVIKSELNEYEDFFQSDELPPEQNVDPVNFVEASQAGREVVQMESQTANITNFPDNMLVENHQFPHCSQINMIGRVEIKSEVNEPEDSFDNNYDTCPVETFDEIVQEESEQFESQTTSKEVDINRNPENHSNDQLMQESYSHPLENIELSDSSRIKSNETTCASTQTDNSIYQSHLTHSIDPASPRSLDEAVSLMYDIDKEILRLTELRQSLFVNLSRKDKEVPVQPKPSIKRKPNRREKKRTKRIKVTDNETKVADTTIIPETSAFSFNYQKELCFDMEHEKILDVKVFNEELTCVSESGQLFFVSMKDGRLLQKVKVTDNGSPATSICFWKSENHIFVGGFDSHLKEYNLKTRMVVKSVPVWYKGSQVQIVCLELCWNFVFIGSSDGVLLRYSLIRSKVEFTDKISESSLLVLKGAHEGARRILIIGSKNAPICIRDAMSGLYMRVMDDLLSPTVYSLQLKKHLLYCGTTSHDILVFNFHDGGLVTKYPVADKKSIGCMKVVNKLLYASCHNGSIYVYNTELHKCVGCIKGPGGIILSMEVVGNLIIVGTMARNFKSIIIPADIINNNK